MVLFLSCSSPQKQSVKEKDITGTVPKTKAERLIKGFRGEGNDPETYQSLYVHVIQNNTNRGLLGSRLKQKLEVAFNSDGRLQVVTEKNEAHVWFYGKILNYQKIPRRFDQFNQVTSFRLGILVQIRVALNPKLEDENYPHARLLIKRRVRFDTNYSPLESPFEAEILANERLLDGLTDRVVYAAVEGWYSALKRADELNREENKNLLDQERRRPRFLPQEPDF